MVASALCLWRMLAFYNLTYPTSSPDPLVLRAACRALPQPTYPRAKPTRTGRGAGGVQGSEEQDRRTTIDGIKYAG